VKTISTLLLFLLISVSYALTSGETGVEGLGAMSAFFIAFGVLIVLYQFIPGLMLFAEALTRIFLSSDRKVSDANRNR